MNTYPRKKCELNLESSVLSRAVMRWLVTLLGLALLGPGFGTCRGAETPGSKSCGR